MKPLSPKTLEKKYAELGLSREKTDLLHDYYRCFANLYGVITVREAWDIFRHYEGSGKLRKADFAAFSGIVQREAGHPYSILEMREVYAGENTDDPADRLIVHNDLILSGHAKYHLLYNTVDHQSGKPYYLPKDKQEFFLYTEDQFYLTPYGREMVRFLSALKTDGCFRDYRGNPCGEITDINGDPVAGKKLSDFVFYTQDERFDIEYHKAESKKERMRREYRTTALEKILYRIRINIQTGGYILRDSLSDIMQHLTGYLERDLGVPLRKWQLEKFLGLFTALNNNSHLWLNCGWSPDDLFTLSGRKTPQSISVGPNMKKLFESGALDRGEFEAKLKELGIEIEE